MSSLDYFTGVIEHTEEMKGVEHATEKQVKGLYRVGLKMEDSQLYDCLQISLTQNRVEIYSCYPQNSDS